MKNSLNWAIKFDRALKHADNRLHQKKNMSLGIRGGYSVIANYQLFLLKYRSISPSSPSPNSLSQLNIDEMDHSLWVWLNYKILWFNSL